MTTRTLCTGIPTTDAAPLPTRQHLTWSSTIFEPFFRRCVIRPAKLDLHDEEKRSPLTRDDGLYALPSLDEGRALLSGYCSTSAFEDSHQTNGFEITHPLLRILVTLIPHVANNMWYECCICFSLLQHQRSSRTQYVSGGTERQSPAEWSQSPQRRQFRPRGWYVRH